MELSNLETLFDEARKLSGHAEYVVVGSLSALGIARAGDVPPRMLLSVPIIESRFLETVFLDGDERRRALDAFALDRARRAKPDISSRRK